MHTLQQAPMSSRSAGFLERAAGAVASCCSRVWSAGLGLRERGNDQMRLVGSLAISHGGTVSIVEFQSERFLVATGPKGQISVMALQGSKAGSAETSCPVSRETSKDKRKRTPRQVVQL